MAVFLQSGGFTPSVSVSSSSARAAIRMCASGLLPSWAGIFVELLLGAFHQQDGSERTHEGRRVVDREAVLEGVLIEQAQPFHEMQSLGAADRLER